MKDIKTRQLEVGDTVSSTQDGELWEFEITRITPKFAVYESCTDLYFRRMLSRHNGKWKTCERGKNKKEDWVLNEAK